MDNSGRVMENTEGRYKTSRLTNARYYATVHHRDSFQPKCFRLTDTQAWKWGLLPAEMISANRRYSKVSLRNTEDRYKISKDEKRSILYDNYKVSLKYRKIGIKNVEIDKRSLPWSPQDSSNRNAFDTTDLKVNLKYRISV
ncbi:hypothetical protein AVEN_246788-1 [Araneus ventricosus]|uniref:Uncharacterized protein n=1 Tax=Araneus ventricosus TaxID=182803 RepID=A0A4Y2FVR5_ARAVE|nr:hypothetical protein AVEN_246788-1 [Araneus ventricosus]